MSATSTVDRIGDVKGAFEEVLRDFEQSPAMRRFSQGKIDRSHYAELLRQISHHARENPQIQALATVYFRGRQRDLVAGFYKHASQEIGHDQLALNDLAALGYDASQVPFERPLPETTALIAFPFYQIQHHNPVGYLGYLFFLEFTPTQRGAGYLQRLSQLGISADATSFIHDHATIDVAHNKLMERYVRDLIRDEEDLDAVVYCMRTTGILYANMISAAFAQADNPRDYGKSAEEFRYA